MDSATLNRLCQCISPNQDRLNELLMPAGAEGPVSFGAGSLGSMFAGVPVFVEDETVLQLERLVHAVHEVVANPQFQAAALLQAPALARVNQGTRGVLYGFDFHLSAAGPRLIEINSNAGGALLNVALSSAQQGCCDSVTPYLRRAGREEDVAATLVQGFRAEYALARGAFATLRSVAIVDESPRTQFLYPEFLLFKALFRQHGIEAHIADPSELVWRDGSLWVNDTPIDMVYNRLTDFYFEAEPSRVLREAYVADEVVVTPHPRAHALFANKRHLALLSDAAALTELGVAEETVRLLVEMVPHAEVVTRANQDRLWASRRGLFFKPLTGFGSKAAYRGDKLTKTTWDWITTQDYLAQAIVPPSERVIRVRGELVPLKLDLRAYVDQERIVLLASRLYRGQTTNFRTEGGGFAAVLATPNLSAV